MNKLYILAIALFFSFHLSAQIPNNGFENWTQVGNYTIPDGWGTLNPVTSSAGTYTCLKGTPGYPGAYYLKLMSNQVNGMGIIPGIAVCGVLNTSTYQAVSGIPCSSRPEALEGNWQYMAFGDDQGYISVLLTRWNTSAGNRDTIAYTYYPLPGMVMSWRNFAIPLTYMSGMFPDTAVIVASASNANGAVTAPVSYLYLDNLSFSGTVAGTGPTGETVKAGISPNPCNDFITFSISRNEAFEAAIYDLHGKQLSSFLVRNGSVADVRHLTPGLYLLRITSGNSSTVTRFCVSR